MTEMDTQPDINQQKMGISPEGLQQRWELNLNL